jgi:hypothetical protein
LPRGKTICHVNCFFPFNFLAEIEKHVGKNCNKFYNNCQTVLWTSIENHKNFCWLHSGFLSVAWMEMDKDGAWCWNFSYKSLLSFGPLEFFVQNFTQFSSYGIFRTKFFSVFIPWNFLYKILFSFRPLEFFVQNFVQFPSLGIFRTKFCLVFNHWNFFVQNFA